RWLGSCGSGIRSCWPRAAAWWWSCWPWCSAKARSAPVTNKRAAWCRARRWSATSSG
ncbi:hypothetical protein SM139_3497, partial [Stenotrophomonas maltophilia]